MEGWISYVGPLVALVGLILTIWWKVEGKISAASDKAEAAQRDLAAHKLHVATHYVSKEGHREATQQIMEAISGVKSAVDAMTLRIDRVVEGQPKARTTRSG
jgi:Tfp pilus assembly protein PilF